MWSLPVQCDALGVGRVYAEVYAHQGWFSSKLTWVSQLSLNTFYLNNILTRSNEYTVQDADYVLKYQHWQTDSNSASPSAPQNIDFPLPCPLEVFEMLVVPEQTYPLICVAVSKGTELNQVVKFGTVNPNTTSSWFTEAGEDSLGTSVQLKTQVVLRDVVKHGSQNNSLSLSSFLIKTCHRRV